jgi:hypothetical protein
MLGRDFRLTYRFPMVANGPTLNYDANKIAIPDDCFTSIRDIQSITTNV